jgi:endonuclease
LVAGDVARQEAAFVSDEEADDAAEAEALPGSSEFLLEKVLQRCLPENLECIEAGLKLFIDDYIRGVEYEAGNGRRIDILASAAGVRRGASPTGRYARPT